MSMKRYATIVSLAIAASAPAAIGYAADDPSASTEAHISESMKAAGTAAKRDANVVVAAVKEDAEKIGVQAKKAAHEVADATKKGAHEIKEVARDIAAKTKAAVNTGRADQSASRPTQ